MRAHSYVRVRERTNAHVKFVRYERNGKSCSFFFSYCTITDTWRVLVRVLILLYYTRTSIRTVLEQYDTRTSPYLSRYVERVSRLSAECRASIALSYLYPPASATILVLYCAHKHKSTARVHNEMSFLYEYILGSPRSHEHGQFTAGTAPVQSARASTRPLRILREHRSEPRLSVSRARGALRTRFQNPPS